MWRLRLHEIKIRWHGTHTQLSTVTARPLTVQKGTHQFVWFESDTLSRLPALTDNAHTIHNHTKTLS